MAPFVKPTENCTLKTDLLSLQNVSARRGERIVLHNLTWTLRPGEHWAVMGTNGAGTSSFLALLAGRLPVLDGTRTVQTTAIEWVANGLNDDFRLATGGGFYQQRFNADAAEEAPTVRDWLQDQVRPPGTVRADSVAMPPPTYPDDWLREVARQLHLDALLDRRLVKLSTGETRRALLARSLLRRPRVLLLDKPFAGLDTENRRLLHELLNEIQAGGTSLVLVTTPQEWPAYLTHVLELRAGHLHWQGPRAAYVPPPVEPTAAPVPLTDVLGGTEHWPSFTHAIRMRGVTVRYGTQTILHDLHWRVRRGEKWAVLGPNGSGKSTLLSLITADHPQGYANDFDLFDRRRGTGESIWDIKKHIGFLSSELHAYFPRHTTVWQAVASGFFDATGLYRRLTPGQAQRITLLLDAFELRADADRPLGQLSLGQQRWVLLARALVKNPPLLVLDEPAQGLDAAHARILRQGIDAWCTATDRTLLYVSHYADELPSCLTHTLRLP
jgi:molybdate transport system ATP-binding protein